MTSLQRVNFQVYHFHWDVEDLQSREDVLPLNENSLKILRPDEAASPQVQSLSNRTDSFLLDSKNKMINKKKQNKGKKKLIFKKKLKEIVVMSHMQYHLSCVKKRKKKKYVVINHKQPLTCVSIVLRISLRLSV